jgi:SAM-dependent methyltransferase
MIISDNVWEHVSNPTEFLSEAKRVLKKGGLYFAKTPNKYHYMTLIAMNTPHWFHEFYNSLRGRSHEDTFPTHYKLNSRFDIDKWAEKVGFEVTFFETYEGRPEYLKISSILYLFGVIYERVVNWSKFFEKFRVVSVVALRKI